MPKPPSGGTYLVDPRDAYPHEPEPVSNYNESMYFNFFDRSRKSGGFVRLGNRANEGYAEMTIALYLPDGSVLFQYKRPEITSNDAFDASAKAEIKQFLSSAGDPTTFWETETYKGPRFGGIKEGVGLVLRVRIRLDPGHADVAAFPHHRAGRYEQRRHHPGHVRDDGLVRLPVPQQRHAGAAVDPCREFAGKAFVDQGLDRDPQMAGVGDMGIAHAICEPGGLEAT